MHSKRREGRLWGEIRLILSLGAMAVTQRDKPTVVGGVDAFEQAPLGPEGGDAVPLAVKHLQSGEDGGVQVRQPVVPHVQLRYVPQQVRLVRHHAGDLIQPDRGSRQRGGSGRGLSWEAGNVPPGILMKPFFICCISAQSASGGQFKRLIIRYHIRRCAIIRKNT